MKLDIHFRNYIYILLHILKVPLGAGIKTNWSPLSIEVNKYNYLRYLTQTRKYQMCGFEFPSPLIVSLLARF